MIHLLFHGGDTMLGRGLQLTFPHQAPNEEALSDSTRAENYLFMAMHREHLGRILLMDSQELESIRQQNADGTYLWGDYVDDLVIRPPPDMRILNLETAVTDSISNKDIPRKGINYHMHAKNLGPVFTKFAATTFTSEHHATGHVDTKVCAAPIPYVISFANNHAMDFGRVVGAGMDLLAAQRAARVGVRRDSIQRKTVSVIAVTTVDAGTPYAWGATPRRSGMVCLPSIISNNGVDQAIAMLTQVLRANAYQPTARPHDDLLVLSIHWGPNWAYRSSLRDDLDFQRCRQQLAHRVIRELGVDVIYGHSSHHIRGLELFDGKLIIYGAGDLINDYEGFENPGDEAYNTLGALFLVDVNSHDGTLASLWLIPTTVYRLQLKRVRGETLLQRRPRREREEELDGVLTSLASTINKYSRWDVGDHGRSVQLRVVANDDQVPGGAILVYT